MTIHISSFWTYQNLGSTDPHFKIYFQKSDPDIKDIFVSFVQHHRDSICIMIKAIVDNLAYSF